MLPMLKWCCKVASAAWACFANTSLSSFGKSFVALTLHSQLAFVLALLCIAYNANASEITAPDHAGNV